ncbi:MAG: outer membrane beta-barrel protein [Crocinitomicaceae bacterium]
MKKTILALGCALAIIAGTNYSNAQVEEGSLVIDPYYGFPNFGERLASSITSENIDDLDVAGFGPAGIRLEYMVADKFGVGLDFIYNSVSVRTQIDSVSNGSVVETYDLDSYARRFRMHLRLNYHFINEDNFDAYVGVGGGTNTRSFGYNTDYPNYEEGDSGTGALIPFSMRFALGSRYYFTDNIGLNLEIGIGGPVVSGGISFKF